jgi:hypothetical protein
MQKPGASKATPITAGAPGQSHLFELITAADDDDRMPQKDEALPGSKSHRSSDGLRKERVTMLRIQRFRWLRWPDWSNSHHHPTFTALRARDGIGVSSRWKSNGRRRLPRNYLVERERRCVVATDNECRRANVGLAYNHEGTLLASASGTPGKLGEANSSTQRQASCCAHWLSSRFDVNSRV